jgi:tRNA nucleotidyltransferase/poly(A) polymerase
MVHRCRILINLHHRLAVHHHRRVLNRLLEVSLPQVILHLLEQHKMLLTIQQVLHQQINLLHRAVVVNPKQAKLKQPAIVTKAHHLLRCH